MGPDPYVEYHCYRGRNYITGLDQNLTIDVESFNVFRGTDDCDHRCCSYSRNQNGAEGKKVSNDGIIKTNNYSDSHTLKLFHFRLEGKNAGSYVWKRNDCVTFGCRTENRKVPKLECGSSYLTETGSCQQKLPGPPKAPQNIRKEAFGQSYPSTAQQPGLPSSIMPRGLKGQSTTSYMFRHNPHQQKVNEKNADHSQGVKTIQKAPSYQLRLKEKDNSLRILSAVIESMKHWSQYTNKTPLLFEVLGILDSAVTPGLYGAKTFLLRDGKESVSCIFYEIDRELPRLIRGRAHRCVGNYDTSRKLFRCVSVRPASVPEQQTFQDFVRIADVAMAEYVKTSNEI